MFLDNLSSFIKKKTLIPNLDKFLKINVNILHSLRYNFHIITILYKKPSVIN